MACLPQKVNEKLSGNVLRNWDRFVDGLQDVTVIQGNIEVPPTPDSGFRVLAWSSRPCSVAHK
jgi:hypothetical protein